MSSISPQTTTLVSESVDALVRRARVLSQFGGRRILGVTDASRAAKSTLDAALMAALANAHLVERYRDRADLIIHVTHTSDLSIPSASPTTDEGVAR